MEVVGLNPHICKSEGWGSPSTWYIFLWRKLLCMQIKAQSPTKDNRESTVSSKSPWGPGYPLCVSPSAGERAWVGEVGVGREGRGKREERNPKRWLCGGDLLCLCSSPPSFFVLFLRVPLFVPFSLSPSSAFVGEDPGVFFWSTQSFSGTWVLIGWRT